MKLKVALFAILFSWSLFATETPRPNVIFLLCDDLGYGDVGYVQKTRATGSVLIQTPVIDNLATNGTILTDHYCASPVCAPSRASIMTGKLAHSCSMNCADKTTCYDHPILETKTLGTIMRDAGYETYAIGKWGIGGGGETNYPRTAHPLARGFDHYYGFMDHAAGHTYYHYDANLNQCYAGIYESGSRPEAFSGSEYNTINSLTKIPTGDDTWNYWNATKTAEGRYSTDVFIARVKKYIEDHVKGNEEAGTNRPFFMYFAVNTVHGSGRCVQNTSLPSDSANQKDLLVPGGEYKSSTAADGSVIWPLQAEAMESRNTWIDPRYANANIDDSAKRYATTISRLDDALGDLVDYLKRKGIYENTIIIFTSDNGPAEEYGAHPHYFQSNGPEFVGRKRDVYEGGQRIPAFISWPGNPAAAKKVISEPSISPDWMGALEDLIADPEQTHVPVPVSPKVETIYQSDGGSVVDRPYRGGQQRMKRVGDIVYLQAGGFSNPVQVYNIKDDPAEAHPLSSEYLPGFRYRFDGDFADSGLPCTFGSPNVLTAVDKSMGDFVVHGDRQALKIKQGATGQDNNENDYTKGRFQSVKSSLGNGASGAAFTALINAKVAPANSNKAVLWSFGTQASNFSALAADAKNNKLYWYANGAQRAEIEVANMANKFHHYAVVGDSSKVSILVDGAEQASLTSNYPNTTANTYGLAMPSMSVDGLVTAVDTEIENFAVYQQRALSIDEIKAAKEGPVVICGEEEFLTLAGAIAACPNETLTIIGNIKEADPIELSDALTLNIPDDCEIATEFIGTGNIVKQGAGVLTLTGSLPSGGLTIDLNGVTPGETPWTVATLAGVPNLKEINLINGPLGATLAAQGKRVVVLAAGETLEQPKIIALNLNAGRGRENDGNEANKLASGTDAGIPDWVLPGSAWTQVMTPSSSEAQELMVFDEGTQSAVTYDPAPKATWSAKNNYTVNNNSANVLEGYLDDGNRAQVAMTDIPFKTYDVLILAATDSDNKKFSPVTVNGLLYKSNEQGEGVSASGAADTWGASRQTSITLGVNAFYVRGLTGPLSITGGENANGARGGIAAVVVFEKTDVTRKTARPVKIIVR